MLSVKFNALNIKRMKYSDLVLEAANEIKPEKLEADAFVNWLINNNRISDLLSIIKSDSVENIELKKEYCGKKSIDRLKNSDSFVQIATFFGATGHMKEAEEIFNNLLALTPNDTSALIITVSF